MRTWMGLGVAGVLALTACGNKADVQTDDPPPPMMAPPAGSEDSAAVMGDSAMHAGGADSAIDPTAGRQRPASDTTGGPTGTRQKAQSQLAPKVAQPIAPQPATGRP